MNNYYNLLKYYLYKSLLYFPFKMINIAGYCVNVQFRNYIFRPQKIGAFDGIHLVASDR